MAFHAHTDWWINSIYFNYTLSDYNQNDLMYAFQTAGRTVCLELTCLSSLSVLKNPAVIYSVNLLLGGSLQQEGGKMSANRQLKTRVNMKPQMAL